MHAEFTINGTDASVEFDDNTLLIDTIRESFGLTGTKKSCDMEVCGACTVLLDGQAVSACTTLSAELHEKELVTVEGLASDDVLNAVQQAFVDHGAAQCGFCTPGMVMTVQALVLDHPDADEETIRRYLSGTICRCTGYIKIIEAAKQALATHD